MIHYTLSNNRLLPIEYLEVAYIESTGTLWIDTEYIITKDTYFDVKYMRISSSSTQSVFGYRSVNSPSAVGDMIFFFVYSNGKIGVRYGNKKQDSSNSYSGICNLISDGTSVRLNNELIILNISYSDSYSPKKAYLFAVNVDGYADSDVVNFTGRIYHCIILESGVLKRHFIPCYRKSDNKPGLFDIVEKKFYINKGTGEFLVGENIQHLECDISEVGNEVPQTRINATLNNIGYSYGIEGQYDKNIYTEPDGSKWIRIFHHNDPTNNGIFDASDTFTTGVYKDENRWFDVAKCNEVNKWELILKLKMTSDGSELKFRWIQYVNPMTGTFNDVAYDKIKRIEWVGDNFKGGLYNYNSSNTYLSQNNNKSGNWFGALGAKSIYLSGFPAFGGSWAVTTGYVDLYLRIDNVCPIYKGCYKLSMTSGLAIPNNGIKAISIWRKGVDPSKKFVMFNGPIRGYEWLASINGNSTGVGDYITSVDYYLDGEPVSKFVSDDKWHHYVFNNISSSSNIPTWYFNIYNHNTGEWDCECYIQDLRLYDRVLTDDEIKKLYNMRNV